MTKFRIEAHDGRVFDVEGPEGATAEQALAQVQQSYRPEAPETTMLDRGKALLGGVNRGISGLVGLPVDTAENLLNLGAAGAGTAATALGRPDLAPGLLKGSFGGSESIARLMSGAGIGTTNPNPQDAPSRLLHTGGIIAGGSMIPGASPRGALTAATGGALAGGTLGPEWGGVGAMAPAAAQQAAAGLKNAVAARAAPVVQTFKESGTLPSVGQATDNVFLHGLENLASKFPGGAGVMQKFIQNQQARMGAQARTGVPTEAAGRAIESGVTGEGGFLDRTRATWKMLDNELAKKVGPGNTFAPRNTVTALDDLTRQVKTAEASTAQPLDARIAKYKEQITSDLANNNGVMSFAGLRTIRSRVGAE